MLILEVRVRGGKKKVRQRRRETDTKWYVIKLAQPLKNRSRMRGDAGNPWIIMALLRTLSGGQLCGEDS